jgi:hypothetical protein
MNAIEEETYLETRKTYGKQFDEALGCFHNTIIALEEAETSYYDEDHNSEKLPELVKALTTAKADKEIAEKWVNYLTAVHSAILAALASK